jgi:hypothetical protein
MKTLKKLLICLFGAVALLSNISIFAADNNMSDDDRAKMGTTTTGQNALIAGATPGDQK